MKKAYLKNGEEVQLHETLQNGQFIIERLLFYCNNEGEEWEEPSGTKEVVNQVFLTPPIEKKHEEFVAIVEKINTEKQELSDIRNKIIAAKNELRQIEECKTNLSQKIINRSELLSAKRLTVFTEDYTAYDLQEGKDIKNASIAYEIAVLQNKFTGWACGFDIEGRKGNRFRINEKYGILIDATDEEILEIGKQIVKDAKNVSDWDLKHKIPVVYLTDELRAKREHLLRLDNEKEIEIIEAEIKNKQRRLETLKTKIT